MRREVKKVCLVSPFPPPYGGMAIQATKLIACLEEAGMSVLPVRTNTIFPPSLQWLQQIPFVRTCANSLLFLVRLRAAALQADVIYFLTGFFNFFFWVTYPALILMKLSGKPVVLSARGGAAREFFRRYRVLLAPMMRRLEGITTPSGFLQQAFVDAFNMTPVIVPNIADLEQFTFRERTSLQPRLIVTRSLEEIYNVGCVIRAFATVHDRYPEATLAVVGDGSLRRQTEELVGDLHLQQSVTFHGRVDHAQIQALYDVNDIFVNASNVDNLPGTILEAYACGLPVVTTRAGGIPYIVADRTTGLLVDCNDCAGLANGVIELLGNTGLAQALIKNGHDECKRYSMDRVRETLLPVLERALGKT